ncbi:MAG: hypothetical protein JWM59_970 [Verrucomicrobiales bacterium]|nr:hypothetical protein [Verrucomicrobiales bacterium]
MSSSPQKTLANLVVAATAAGLFLWRENHWQARLRHPAETVAGPGAPASQSASGGSAAAAPQGVTDNALLEQNADLQKQLLAVQQENGSLQAKVAELNATIEASKPPPTPADLITKFTGQRGLIFDPPLKLQPVPLDDILTKITQSVNAALPEPSADARARAAVAMGMTNELFDYRASMASLASMTSGGFYQQETNTLFYRQEASLMRADGRELFISALAPALLAQFPLTRQNHYDTGNDDAAIAALSLVNGDANSARVRFSITDQMAQNFDRAGTPAPGPSSSSAPAYLSEIWKFTHDKGSLFAEAVIGHGKGGLTALNAAYARPPRTTSEVMHPETLYLGPTPFTPVDISLPDPMVAGAAPYFANTAGEFGAYIILRSWFDVDSATVASEGWMGDRYLVWKGPETFGDQVFWKTAWRTDQDAREFFDILRRSLMQRFSIPWRADYDAVPNQFTVTDPRRIIRLILNPATNAVTLQNSTDPAFAAELEKAAARWQAPG